MMPLFKKHIAEDDVPFDKEEIIKNVKNNLKEYFRDWHWCVIANAEEPSGDLLMYRMHYVREEIQRDENPYNPYKKIKDSIYHIMSFVYIDEEYRSPSFIREDGGYFIMNVSSERDLYKMLKKIDSLHKE